MIKTGLLPSEASNFFVSLHTLHTKVEEEAFFASGGRKSPRESGWRAFVLSLLRLPALPLSVWWASTAARHSFHIAPNVAVSAAVVYTHALLFFAACSSRCPRGGIRRCGPDCAHTPSEPGCLPACFSRIFLFNLRPPPPSFDQIPAGHDDSLIARPRPLLSLFLRYEGGTCV